MAIEAQNKTNCVTEILFPEAEEWVEKEINLKGPLAGIPVSLKDSIAVKGFDTSVGYSCNTGKPWADDGAMVKILKDAGGSHYYSRQECSNVLQALCPSSRRIYQQHYSPSNLPTMYGAAAQIHITTNILREDQLEERQLCLLLEGVVLALDLMLLGLSELPRISLAATRYAARLEDGLRWG